MLGRGLFFFFKQKTAYELRISDWSSDVCSSDLKELLVIPVFHDDQHGTAVVALAALENALRIVDKPMSSLRVVVAGVDAGEALEQQIGRAPCRERVCQYVSIQVVAGSLNKKREPNNYTTKAMQISIHQKT